MLIVCTEFDADFSQSLHDYLMWDAGVGEDAGSVWGYLAVVDAFWGGGAAHGGLWAVLVFHYEERLFNGLSFCLVCLGGGCGKFAMIGTITPPSPPLSDDCIDQCCFTEKGFEQLAVSQSVRQTDNSYERVMN